MAAKLVIGCGYLGRRVADAWRAAGDKVYAVTRSEQRAAEFAENGLHPIVADLTRDVPTLLDVDSVLFAISRDRSADATADDVYVGGLRRTIAALERTASLPTAFLFISTTGVYGDAAGDEDGDAIVDETTPCRPARDSGVAYVEAERLLAESSLGERSIVLRLAGIYGPGRIPMLEPLRRGESLPVREEASLNLIHVEDAVSTILACELNAPKPSLYCVSDGSPVRRGDWYRAVAAAFELPEPTFSSPLTDGSRRGGDKRISPAKLVREIDPPFRYPSYSEGLAAEVARLRDNDASRQGS